MRNNISKVGFVLSIVVIAAFSGCARDQVQNWDTNSYGYGDISSLKAKELIEENRGNKDFKIIDVRTPAEYSRGRIEGAELIDYTGPDFREKIAGLDREGVYLLYCRTGTRSGAAKAVMRNKGFKKIYNLSGGTIGWEESGYSLTE